MPTPIETVTAFVAEWSKSPDALRAAFRDYFTPATVWENVGFSTTTGIDEAIGLLDGFAAAGIVTIPVEILNIAAAGNIVLTERVDHMVGADGKTLMSIRLMGIFEIENGRIKAWRDYFDTAKFSAG